MQVGPGDGFRLRIGGFNEEASTASDIDHPPLYRPLGNSFTDFVIQTTKDLNGMKFSTKYDVKH